GGRDGREFEARARRGGGETKVFALPSRRTQPGVAQSQARAASGGHHRGLAPECAREPRLARARHPWRGWTHVCGPRGNGILGEGASADPAGIARAQQRRSRGYRGAQGDRKSTRLNSSHVSISYAVFCLKNKNNKAMYDSKLNKGHASQSPYSEVAWKKMMWQH